MRYTHEYRQTCTCQIDGWRQRYEGNPDWDWIYQYKGSKVGTKLFDERREKMLQKLKKKVMKQEKNI